MSGSPAKVRCPVDIRTPLWSLRSPFPVTSFHLSLAISSYLLELVYSLLYLLLTRLIPSELALYPVLPSACTSLHSCTSQSLPSLLSSLLYTSHPPTLGLPPPSLHIHQHVFCPSVYRFRPFSSFSCPGGAVEGPQRKEPRGSKQMPPEKKTVD